MYKKKIFVAFFTIILIVSLSLNVLGAGTLIDINAQMDTGITIMLNGKKYQPVDPQDGSNYVPIVYKGRIYLPIRPVAEDIAGMQVTWDPNTRTAYLGSQSGEVGVKELSWFNVTPEFTHNGTTYYTKSRNAAVLTTSNGKTFEFGYTYEDPDYYAGYSIHFNTDYQYHKFKATFWVDEQKNESGEYVSKDAVIEIKDEFDSVLYK